MLILKVLFLIVSFACAALVGALSLRRKSRESDEILINWPGIALALLVAAGSIALVNAFGQVPAGMRGVVTSFGAPTGEVKGEGLYAVVPLAQGVELMDVQTHAHKAPARAASRDLQEVSTEITLNFSLDPMRVVQVYRTLRRDYEQRIIEPSVQEAVKAATAQFDAERLIVEREQVRADIERILRERLLVHGILLDQMSITNFEFGQAFTEAIEGKVTATQNALKAQNEVVSAKAHADAAIAEARGKAEAIRIQTEAISAHGGDDYVRLQAILKWDGGLPQVMSGTAPLPFLNLSTSGAGGK